MMAGSRKCHMLELKSSRFNRDSNPHDRVWVWLGEQTGSSVIYGSSPFDFNCNEDTLLSGTVAYDWL